MYKVSLLNIYSLAKKLSEERHEQKKNYKSHLALSGPKKPLILNNIYS